MLNKKAMSGLAIFGIVSLILLILIGGFFIARNSKPLAFYPSGLESASVRELSSDSVSQTFQMDWSASNYRREKYGCAEFEVPSSYDNYKVPEFKNLQEDEWFRVYEVGVQMQGGYQPTSEKAFCKVKKISRGADTPRAFLTCKYSGCWDVQYTYENFGNQAVHGINGLKNGFFKVRIPQVGVECFDDSWCSDDEICQKNICNVEEVEQEETPEETKQESTPEEEEETPKENKVSTSNTPEDSDIIIEPSESWFSRLTNWFKDLFKNWRWI